MNIDVVDYTNDSVMKTDRAMHPNAIIVHNVQEMVQGILNRIGSERIDRLQIFGHGMSGIVGIADSHLMNNPNQVIGLNQRRRLNHENLLSRLRGHFAPNAVVILQGCQVGLGPNGREVLRQLSRLWNVRVRAGAEDQYPDRADSIEGPIIEAVPNNGHPRVHLGH